MQTQLQFTTHHRENNSRSESHLKAHKAHFSEQCTKLYNILKTGTKLTVLEAMTDHGIGSLPRRVKDLKDGGIKIDFEKVPGTRYIRYFIPQP
jgi:hypothetical protein